jgi:hypothetical protein
LDGESLEKWKNKGITAEGGPDSVIQHETTTEKDNPSGTDPQSGPAELLERFLQSMNSVSATIALTNVTGAMAIGMFIEGGLFAHAQKNLRLMEQDDKITVFDFKRSQFSELKKLLDLYVELKEGHATLPSATLLSVVATFDAYFAEIVRYFLDLHSDRYSSSQRQISLKEVFKKKTLQEVIDQVLDNEIGELMRGSHTEQVKFVEANLNVQVIDYYERWPDFVEIFERRNLVAHGNLIVNELYLDRCRDAKLKIHKDVCVGKPLTLTPEYLRKSVGTLMEFGMLLNFMLWRKHIPDSNESAFSCVSDSCYQLIYRKRYNVAKNVLSFCLFKQKPACSDNIIRMMAINLANAYKKLKINTECQKVLDNFDWSATKNEFQLCMASLQDDVDRVVTLMPGIAASSGVTSNEFREWPVLDWVREDPRIQEAFSKVYGEPMRTEVSSTSEMASDATTGTAEDTASDSQAPVNVTRH